MITIPYVSYLYYFSYLITKSLKLYRIIELFLINIYILSIHNFALYIDL